MSSVFLRSDTGMLLKKFIEERDIYLKSTLEIIKIRLSNHKKITYIFYL